MTSVTYEVAASTSTNCIHTTAGPVEADVSGTGTPILILHGSPAGIDAARSMSRFLDKDAFKVICLSRPGYLNTPLLSKQPTSIDAEADLHAALLDALHIPCVGVLAWSGGGPAAYRLAARHPDRVSCLVANAALSGPWIAPKLPLTPRILFGTRFGEAVVHFLSGRSPRNVVAGALKGEGSLRGAELDALTEQVMADPAQRRLVLEMVMTVNTGGRREQGWLNDVKNFGAITELAGLEEIRCPVLLVHGDADTDVVPSNSESAHARLSHSTLVMMSRGTHLSFYAHPEASDVQDRTCKFFLEHARGSEIGQPQVQVSP